MLPLFPQDYIDTEMLLCAENVNQDHLLSYAREAADFATNYQLPSLDFAMNHYEQPDVAMFDFTCMYASENAALVRERQSHQLLVALVGDSLLEVPPARGAPSLLPEERSSVHVCLAASAVTQLGEGRPSASRQAQLGLRDSPSTKSRGAHVSVSARELSSPPRDASGLTTWLKYKLRGPGLDVRASFSEHMVPQLGQDPFLMWVGLCGLATLRSCRMQERHVGPESRFCP